MSSDTFASKRFNLVYVKGDRHTESTVTGEAGIYPGYPIRLSSGKAYLCKAGEAFAGVAINPPGYALDDVIPISTAIDYYPAGQDTVVIMHLLYASPIVAIVYGDKMKLSATDGHIMKFVYANGTGTTDSSIDMVGKARAADTGHLSLDHLIPVHIGG